MKRATLFASVGVGALSVLFCVSSALAIPCTGVNISTSMTSDVTLHGINSSQCEIASGNSGKAGGNSALIPTDGMFAGGAWSQIGSEGTVTNSGAVPGLVFTGLNFSGGNSQNGTWGLSWTGSGGVDLLFSMHAGGFSGFFDFNNVVLPSNSSWAGTWLIDWVNNGNQHPDESNWQVWARVGRNVRETPEPSILGLFGIGLVVFGAARRRRAGFSSP